MAELYDIGQTVWRTFPEQSCESHENYFPSQKESNLLLHCKHAFAPIFGPKVFSNKYFGRI